MSKHQTHHVHKEENEQAHAAESVDESLAFTEEQKDSNNTEFTSGQPAQTAQEEGIEGRIAELEGQIAELNDQFLRKAAEFENFRKRLNQDKQNAIEFANQSLLLDIIPVIDDFERAIQSAVISKDFNGFLEGITMIEKQLTGQLESKWGLKRFNSAGEPFDPNRHEAFMVEKSPDVTEAVVQEDMIKGYFLKDRLIRTAKVKVLMPEQPVQKGEDE